MDASLLGQLAAGSPLAVGIALVSVALAVAKRVLASVGRLGARVGRLEQGRIGDRNSAALERVRRWQLETALLEAGIPVPPWPDSPADVAPAPVPRHALPDWSPAL